MCKVYSAFHLLFYVSKFLGFAPYALMKNGKLIPSSIAKKYSIILCIVVIAAEIKVFAVEVMKDTPLLLVGLVLLSLSSVVTHILSVFMSINGSKKFIRISEKINIFDSMFHQTLDVRKKQFYSLVAQIMIGSISLGSYLFWANIYIGNKEEKWEGVVTKLICVLGDYIIVLQYTNLVVIFGQYFSHINIQLIELDRIFSQKPTARHVETGNFFISHVSITSAKPVRHELRDRVSCFMDLYEKLFDATRFIDSAYSLQILLIVAKIFVHITFCLYLVFVVIFSTYYDKCYSINALFFCFWAIFQLVLIIVCCDYTKGKVSRIVFK